MSTPMPSPPITSVTRQLSRRSVFEALLHRSPISRADLAKVTGLSKQTMSEVIDAFEQQGLVRQMGRTSGNVGRTAVLYELSPEGGHVLAIELAPNITGLDHLNVVGLLGEKLGSPVVLENDINLALLGEIWHGCAQNVDNVAFLALGSGVGLGLYVNGRLVRGENGAAGEIGYLPIGGDPLQADSRLQGCLEYQIGANGVVRR